jgi:pyocin large subunit-like protein
MSKITLLEAKKLLSLWSKGTFPTVAESIKYHFTVHGKSVSAKNVWQYLRKVESFAANLRGARKSILDNESIRFMKGGHYIIKNREGKILSFGIER